MNYDFSEKEFLFFLRIHELAAQVAGESEITSIADLELAMRNILPLLAETPYLTLGIEPVSGMSPMLAATAAAEAFSAVAPTLCLAIEMSVRVFGRAVSRWGESSVKKEYLEGIKAGKCIGAVALSEAGVNIENEPLSASGVTDGDRVVVNGRKQYVVNAGIADVIAVAGFLDGRRALFLVDRGNPGLKVENPVNTFGFDGLDMAAVLLEDCEIPADRVIVGPEKPDMFAMLRHWENQAICGVSLGLSKSAFEAAKDYAKSHKSGGKPIIAFQEVGFAIAEMLTLYQTAQLLAYRAAWTDDDNPSQGPELTLCAKIFCTEGAEQIAGQALRILGGYGHVRKNPAELALRSAKYCQVFGTSTEIARVKLGGAAMGIRVL